MSFFTAHTLRAYFRSPRHIVAGIIAVLFFLFLITAPLRAPDNFPTETVITIESGSSVSSVAAMLHEKRIIRSPLLFRLFVSLQLKNSTILAGEYAFEKRTWVAQVAHRVTHGLFGIAPVSVTIPEGTSAAEMTSLFSSVLSDFNPETFLAIANKKEGYLFPDTYTFQPSISEELIVAIMEEHFVSKIKEIQEDIDSFGRSLQDVVIMASLLEEEARTTETRRIIAGILWKRLDIGMPLQVDAVFPYIISKNTFEVTLDDLNVDSPYNTYRYAGLPIGPITNPGLDAILAAVTPIETDYLFYLSDADGIMHYAEDFDGHIENRRRFLD